MEGESFGLRQQFVGQIEFVLCLGSAKLIETFA